MKNCQNIHTSNVMFLPHNTSMVMEIIRTGTVYTKETSKHSAEFISIVSYF